MKRFSVTVKQKRGKFIVKAKCGGVIPDQEVIFDRLDQVRAFLDKLEGDTGEIAANALDLREEIIHAQKRLSGGK
jgi:hypothetical protein